jgi:hypothetical protein
MLTPLLKILENNLNGIHIGRNKPIAPVIAYADDITVLVTKPGDYDKIRQSIKIYEKATRARLNTKKSKALAIANWTAPATALGIGFQNHITILGIKYTATIRATIKANLDHVINVIRTQARRAYTRQLSLCKADSIRATIHASKIWYLAQTLPPHTKHVQQITSTCTWYIWRGTPFKVPVTTLRLPKDQGGRAMTEIVVKCGTLLLSRIWALRNKE